MKKFLTAIFLLWIVWMMYPGKVLGQAQSLTIAQLKNATYQVGNQWIKLRNGSYQKGTIKDGNFFAVDFVKAALGDLNNDGKNDAAVIYYSNSGGSGCFLYWQP
jgi:hypothetical protein